MDTSATPGQWRGLVAGTAVAGLRCVAGTRGAASTGGTIALFVVTLTSFAAIRGIDMWQRRNPHEVDLDELVDPPTLRLGLSE